MEYFFTTIRDDGYGGDKHKCKRTDRSLLLRRMSEHFSCKSVAKSVSLYDSKYASVSTLIQRRKWFRQPSLHLPVIDADSHHDMGRACNVISSDGYGYAIVQSGPKNYWIIINRELKFKDAVKYALQIPGSDPRYLDYTARQKRFHVRAFRRLMDYPKFGNSDSLTGLAKEWYGQLERHFNELDTMRLARIHMLALADERQMKTMMADPAFQV